MTEAVARHVMTSMHALFCSEVQWKFALDRRQFRPGRPRSELLDQALQKPNRIGLDRSRYRQKFNDVNATFAALISCNKGLRLPEPLGYLLLSEAGILARRDHQAAKCLLLSTMNGFD